MKIFCVGANRVIERKIEWGRSWIFIGRRGCFVEKTSISFKIADGAFFNDIGAICSVIKAI